MAEYIEQEKAYELASDFAGQASTKAEYSAYWKVARAINELPAADVVKVVRCGQCKHATEDIIVEGVCYCHKIQQGMFLDGFCSYGERRNTK